MKIQFTDALRSADVESAKYDLLICALGYESRSAFLANKVSSRVNHRLCLAFPSQDVLSYRDNERQFEKLRFARLDWQGEASFAGIRQKIEEVVEACAGGQEDSQPHIALDVSSMTREMAAYTFSAISTCLSQFSRSLIVSILYAPAEFQRPKERLVPVSTAGPVIPEYAGWAAYPERPASVVIGLGYEYGRAVGVLDYLDVADTWLFLPRGRDERYDARVDDINSNLYSMLDSRFLIKYDVYDPYDTILKLRSLVEGTLPYGRIVLVPFGPKLFSIACLVIAEMFRPEVSVWRVSGETNEEPIDRVANGDTISMSFQCTSNPHKP